MNETKPIAPSEFLKAEGVEDWRVISEGACAFYRTTSLADSVAFVQAIGELAETTVGIPDIDIRSGGVTVGLITLIDDYYGMTEGDVELALGISAVAQQQGLSPTHPRSRACWSSRARP